MPRGETQAAADAAGVELPETERESGTLLRVTAPWTVENFVYGDHMVTRSGIRVPAKDAAKVIKAADEHGVTIEKGE